MPTQDNVYDLGATGLRFRDLHVGGSTIYLGNTVSLSAASDGTVTLGNANGNVSLISAEGVATYYGIGITDEPVSGSNVTEGYAQRGSNVFIKEFAVEPVVTISMYVGNPNILPIIGATIVATNITTTGFEVYSDVIVRYSWTASANNDV